NLPMIVSTTTSNFMIGVTAATGSSIYWYLGYIQPFIAAGTAIGVLIGAFIGTKILIKITNKTIRWIFSSIIIFLGIEMIIRGIVAIGILLPFFYEYFIPFIVTVIFIIGVYIRVRIKNEK
ncbi:MAG: sulfite exporter TauE/SafE family protein, partial [Thermoproteota archaeon]